MFGSYAASLRNVGGSTQVPFCARNNASRDTLGHPSPLQLESRHMNFFSVLVRRETQPKMS
jgi:hypothetical protein